MRAWMVVVLVLVPEKHLKETALMVMPNGEIRREVRTLTAT